MSPAADASMRDVLVAKLCRLTAIDKVAVGFAAAFVFLTVAFAICASFAIGDAPEGRLWGFLLSWAAVGFGTGIVAPWAMCRMLHAAGHAARFVREQRNARPQQNAPLSAFYEGRPA